MERERSVDSLLLSSTFFSTSSLSLRLSPLSSGLLMLLLLLFEGDVAGADDADEDVTAAPLDSFSC